MIKVTFVALFFFALPLKAEVPPVVQLQLKDHGGSGCPAGSVGVAVSPDQQSLSLLFDKFEVENSPEKKRKNCTLDVELRYPAGWQFTVLTVDYRGFASLGAKSWGQADSRYKFLNGGNALPPSHLKLKGPVEENYYRRDQNGVSPRGHSSCGDSAVMRIDTDIHVGGKGAALMTLDSIDKTVEHAYRLQWKRCSHPIVQE